MAVYAEPQRDSEEATIPLAESASSASNTESDKKKKQKGKKERKADAAENVPSAAAAGAQNGAASASPVSPSPFPSSSLIRYLYYKAHQTNSAMQQTDDTIKAGCTVFVVNIPFYYTSEHLTQLFSCFGTVESCSFIQPLNSIGSAALLLHSHNIHDIPPIGAVEKSHVHRSAYVVYENEESVDMAMKTDLSRMVQPCPEEEEDEQHVGIKHWLSLYHQRHPDVSQLQLQVDRFMEGFDARVSSERAAARAGGRKGEVTDADGWTLVRSSKSASTKRAALEREEETMRAQERAAKKQKKNQIIHFYRHAEREAKKERLQQLREKFEQDKMKIARMKQERKFRPM